MFSGKLLVAEVSSRISDKTEFEQEIVSFGFKKYTESRDLNFFFVYFFEKISSNNKKNLKASTKCLAPCLYKRR